MKRYTLLLVFSAVALFAHGSDKFKIKAGIRYYTLNRLTGTSDFKFSQGLATLTQKDTAWQCREIKKENNPGCRDLTYLFELTKGHASNAGATVSFSFENWSTDNYVIMPSAVYDGNRFDVLKYKYPPLMKPEDYAVEKSVTITDVPRLNKYKGESGMDLNTGDLSTPAVGIFFPKTGKGIWILTEQSTELGNSVLSFTENEARTSAEFSISAPCVRQKIYRMTSLNESTETGSEWKKGTRVTIHLKLYVFDNLKSPAELNNRFLEIRKSIGTSAYVHQISFSAAFRIMEDQQNKECWDGDAGFYTLGGEGWNMKWQLGWVGGCMVTHPLSLIGQQKSRERSFINYNTIITKSQAKTGFYYSCGNGSAWCSDCFSKPLPDNLLLLRKNADALYFFYKYCLSQKTLDPEWEMPVTWKVPLQRLSDGFVALWSRYGQFGQHIDIETGEIKVGGTNSAVVAIAGLALASAYEKRPELLKIASEAAHYYYEKFTLKGISCGGPGEILQNNDSESAFAMLESLITLYEVTGNKEWLKYAEDAAGLCSTWTVSYDYRFPENSLFGKLDMRTTGAVWANVQNKHGAPGICTFSGDCLLKLYRVTGKSIYVELLQDIAHNIMQYISREDRPVSDQHPGWVNERVNLSDWEGLKRVGGIFRGNTWAQVSAMLTVAEIPGIYVNLSKKEIRIFDHVDAVLKGRMLQITNPTKFDANVSIFVDKDLTAIYPQGYISLCPKVLVKAGSTISYRL